MTHLFIICPNRECAFSKKKPMNEDFENFCPSCATPLIWCCPECARPLQNLEKNFCSWCGQSLLKSIPGIENKP